MTAATTTATLSDTIAALKATHKNLKADPSRQEAFLARVPGLCREFSAAPPAPAAPKPPPQPAPADEKPIWLGTKEEIEAWLKKLWSSKTVTIISGLDSDAPTISSPKELDPTLVNVHKDGDSTYVLVEEKQGRAHKDGIHLGLREALLSYVKRKEIHEEWYPYWVYFSDAVVEVDGDRCLVYLNPHAHGCRLNAYRFVYESDDSERFARLRES